MKHAWQVTNFFPIVHRRQISNGNNNFSPVKQNGRRIDCTVGFDEMLLKIHTTRQRQLQQVRGTLIFPLYVLGERLFLPLNIEGPILEKGIRRGFEYGTIFLYLKNKMNSRAKVVIMFPQQQAEVFLDSTTTSWSFPIRLLYKTTQYYVRLTQPIWHQLQDTDTSCKSFPTHTVTVSH